MEIIAVGLMVIGFLLAIVGSLWWLIEVFKSSVLMGIISLFIGIVPLIWLFGHWEEGKTPFLITMAGWGLVIVGFVLAGSIGGGMEVAPIQ